MSGLERTALPSGLRVVTERVPGSRSAAIGMWVGVGSRDEPPEVAGAAHYLEHALFKGTARRSAAQISEEIDAVGGELNAFTTKEDTCYHAHVLDTDLDLGVDLVCDVLGDAQLDPESVDLERAVILSELAIRDDDPEDLLADEFSAALLAGHPLGRPVLGTEESVTGMRAGALARFHRDRYIPERMVLAAAGNVDHEHVVTAVNRSFGHHLDRAAQPEPPRNGQVGIAQPRRLVLRTQDCEQAHLMLGVPAVDRHDPRRWALGVLNAALGGGVSSRLFQQVREQRGLAYAVYSAVETHADTGELAVYAGCAPERLGQVTGVIRQVLGSVARDGLDRAELARGKAQLRGGLVLGCEDTVTRMSRLGKAELALGRPESIEETLARVDAVEAAQVAELAAELLSRPLTAAVVGPYAADDELPEELHEVVR